MLASLEPTFTILHTLATTRAPSPIAHLAWHASSSKQKSDMLAAQTNDGDLRVWSVSKPPGHEQPRVIRVLKRSDVFVPGAHWMAWSKNGRILQFSDKETWAWDVRTKHVSYEQIPTINDVRGIANYGPTAALFTLGPNYSVHQYDIDNPQMVANIQHFPLNGRTEDSLSIPSISASESEDDLQSPAHPPSTDNLVQIGEGIQRSSSVNSSSTHTDSVSSRTSSMRGVYGGRQSPMAKTQKSGTTFSIGTMSQMTKESYGAGGSSLGYPSSFHSPVSGRSYRKSSRLRQEVLRSPDENKPLTELLPWTRARLAEVSFKPVPPFDPEKLTADGLRRQMLRVVFGWEEDIEDLIRAECKVSTLVAMSFVLTIVVKHHPSGSQNALLLSKWLKDDADYLMQLLASSSSSSNMDWMLLALSGLGGDERSKTVGQAFAAKMLGKGDIHTAVSILISLGVEDEAVNVYLGRNYFMEAILLTCLLMPKDWEKQSFLVRKWGEHVVQNSQQHLALRCFSCAGLDPNIQLSAAPSQVLNYAQKAQNVIPIKSTRSGLSDIISSLPTVQSMTASVTAPSASGEKPPSPNANRATPSLKLITSFGPPEGERAFRFPGLKSDDRTPTVMPGVTPIAESAVPGGSAGPGLAPWANGYSQVPSRVTTPGGFARPRLPSIGETPMDLFPPELPIPKPLPTPDNSGDDKNRAAAGTPGSAPPVTSIPPFKANEEPLLLLTSAVYDPGKEGKKRSTPVTALPTGPDEVGGPMSPTLAAFESLKRDKYRPDGLILNWPPVASSAGGSTTRSDTPASYATAQADAASGILSPPSTELSYKSTQSSARKNRSIDRYINSLEEANPNYYSRHHRKIRHSKKSVAGSTDITTSELNDYDLISQSRYAESEESRGRRHHNRHIPPAKRSPSSPVPMAPDHLNMYPADNTGSTAIDREASKPRSRSQPRGNRSKTPDPNGRRHRSESRNDKAKKKSSSKNNSRKHSPDGHQELRGRARNLSDRGSLVIQSPSSPLPMEPSGGNISNPEDALRFVNADMKRRNEQDSRKTPRDDSYRLKRGTSAKRDESPDRRRHRSRSRSRQAMAARSRKNSTVVNSPMFLDSLISPFSDGAPGISVLPTAEPISRPATTGTSPRFVSDERRKELAQAELEARRQSLARRPSAPSIPRPDSQGHHKSASFSIAERIQAKDSPDGSESSGFAARNSKYSTGLPQTPRAMRHPNYNSTYGDKDAPDVPEVPEGLIPLSDSVHYNGYNPIQRSMSAPLTEHVFQSLMANGMPTHPAFQPHLPSSRSSSRTRAQDVNSEPKHSPMSPPAPPEKGPDWAKSNEMPPILPQLQHLAGAVAVPPPPPPPPKTFINGNNNTPVDPAGVINIRYEGDESIVEVSPVANEAPQTVLRASTIPQSPYHSRKDSKDSSVLSGGDNNLMGKFRNMTDRMRSSSRGRGPRSPAAVESQDSPYESIPPMPPPPQLRDTEVQTMNMI